jgi:hypothetical protein
VDFKVEFIALLNNCQLLKENPEEEKGMEGSNGEEKGKRD